jgi:hypothetical protein
MLCKKHANTFFNTRRGNATSSVGGYVDHFLALARADLYPFHIRQYTKVIGGNVEAVRFAAILGKLIEKASLPENLHI